MTTDITDEFMEPVVCDGDGTISDNDSVIFFNFRPDRAREITRAIVDPDFDGFAAGVLPHHLCVQHGVRRLHAQRAGGLAPQSP